MEKISVIIPIFNVEKYLNRCIESIINQTYKNLEILLINDGSTDKSEEICKKYEKIDSRVKYIYKENGGLSDARNVGIENSTGELIAFVDSDDFVSEIFLETLYALLKKEDSDISVCEFTTFSNIEDLKNNIEVKEKIISMESTEAIKSLLEKRPCITNHAWNKLYKKELFSEIRYPKGKNFEDIGTTYLLFDKAKRISYINKKLYFYYIRKDSITGCLSKKSILDKIQLVEIRGQYIKENYKKLKKICDEYEFRNNISMLKELIKIKGSKIKKDTDFIELKGKVIKDKKYNKTKKIDMKEKIIYFIIKSENDFLYNKLKG